MNKTILSQKTTWTGVAMVIAGVASYFAGTMDLNTAVQTVGTGLGLIFLRQAVNK